jgi:hypothetical protein
MALPRVELQEDEFRFFDRKRTEETARENDAAKEDDPVR